MSEPLAHHAALSRDRWQQIEDAFAAVLEADPADREQVLQDRCAGDPALRREVETLLAAHVDPGPVDRLSDAMAPTISWARGQAAGWEGSRVGQYLVLELLGAGGMGLVYKAHDERLGRHVALKFLPPHLSAQAAAKERFLVEARAAAALDHPNICTILEIGETGDGQSFIAMPLYDGQTLQARLKRGRLPFVEAVPVALQIARGAARAHARGIVHRDIKPSNVMLLADATVKILDFGIADVQELSLAGHGAAFGTVAYMSPEHVRGGAVDHRSDIWSLGVVLHEMLTGVRPFGGSDRQSVAGAVLSQDPDLSATSHPDVPAGIDGVLCRALAKLPDDRYSSMAAFADDLTSLAPAGEARQSAPVMVRPDAAIFPHQQDGVPAGERRRAAVLVTSVSDYGALVERLAPVEAHGLVARLRDLAVDVVRRHGGMVNQAIGEEIVALFGVPAAHDDDELRAVRAAIELHARVRELGGAAADADQAIRIQSGLDVGSVVAQRLNEGPRRYGLVGAPGRVAARLAAVAAPDAITLSPECQRLVAPFVHTAACPAVVLEHGTEPVTPFRVTGETGLTTRLEASERSGLTPYVGRDSELALLETYVGRVHAGEGRVMTVVGEAGAGKSRLLHELRERVGGTSRLRILQGRCRAYGDAAPYFPFIEIVRDALNLPAVPEDSRAVVERFRTLDASLERFVPLYLHLLSVPSESHPLPRHLQGEHLQAALLDALAGFMTVLASRASQLVLLEDWHWADAASRAALARLAEIVPAQPLAFVVTTRPEQGGLEDRLPHGTRIQLDPLDFAASAAIVQAVLRVDRVSPGLAQRLFERTGGNPFFLEQVCCALLEQGIVSVRDGEATVEGGPEALSLPATVQAVIRTRIDNLEPPAREVLRVASVIGRELEHTLLAGVLGDEGDLARSIGRLKASGLIRQTSVVPEVGYRFTHVLTQEVSYDSLLAHQRTSLHDSIGRAIEQQHADRLDEKAALLAYHFSRAGAWRKAVDYGIRAADRASALSQFSDALDLLDHALEWLPQVPDEEARATLRADILLQQERACETLGLRHRQQAIITQLISHLAASEPSARLAQTYLREGDLLTLLKRFDTADRALSTALRISRELGDAALERHTLRSIGLLRWHEGRHAEALAITEHALSIDRESGDDVAAAGDLSNLGSILKSMGDYTGALCRLEKALAMPALTQDPKKLAYTLHNLANVHRGLANLDAALAYLRQADEIARIQLLPIQRSFHLTSIAHIELQQGHIDAAIRRYEEAIDLSRRARHAEGLSHALRALGEVLFGLGEGERALPYLLEAARLFAQLEDPAAEADMCWSAATVHERAHRAAESVSAWRRVESLRRQLGDAVGQLEALEGAARATRQIHGASDLTISAFADALRLASTLGDRGRALALRNVLGILEWTRGRYVDALTHYEAALLLARAGGDRVQEGVILNSLGVTLTNLQRPEEARTALEQSVALNRDTGEHLLEAHALAALGQVSWRLDRLDRAVEYFERSRELRREAGDRVGEGWMLRRIADLRGLLGEEAGARDAEAAAARIAAEEGDADLVAACRVSGDNHATLHH